VKLIQEKLLLVFQHIVWQEVNDLKKIFAIGLLFILLNITFMPLIGSSAHYINTDKNNVNNGEEYFEIEVYNFKGIKGCDKYKKYLPLNELIDFNNKINIIDKNKQTLDEKIKLKLEIYKEYDLISEDYSYEKMEKMLQNQKNYLEKQSKKVNYFINNKKYDIKLVNVMNFFVHEMRSYAPFIIGIPPLWLYLKFIIPFISLPDIWATGYIATDDFSLYTLGLLGEKDARSSGKTHFFYFNGIIGISFVSLDPLNSMKPFYSGVGFSAFSLVFTYK
jgi:hypothetical protein